MLAARSTVFRDMIDFPQPMDGSTELVEGIPVVVLHDDPEDLEPFIRAIFDSSYFMPPPNPVQLPVVLSILRLSHKYDVPYLYRRALEHLVSAGWCPTSFSDPTANGLIESLMATTLPPLSVILAATEVGESWLLPWAYYVLASNSCETLNQPSFVPSNERRYVDKCILAHPHLIRGTLAVNRFLTKDYPACETADICRRVRSQTFSEVLDNVKGGVDLDPLGEWQHADRDLPLLLSRGMCTACYVVAAVHYEEAMTEFWESIPAIFGFPAWKELHAQKTAVLSGEVEATS
ncbi:hypothetical protein DFH06DRAFT_1209153 [Mycena polygramma]|nr:hypothetical protein DFH06DRAFT_1209153 [Mycena polygramma]